MSLSSTEVTKSDRLLQRLITFSPFLCVCVCVYIYWETLLSIHKCVYLQGGGRWVTSSPIKASLCWCLLLPTPLKTSLQNYSFSFHLPISLTTRSHCSCSAKSTHLLYVSHFPIQFLLYPLFSPPLATLPQYFLLSAFHFIPAQGETLASDWDAALWWLTQLLHSYFRGSAPCWMKKVRASRCICFD